MEDYLKNIQGPEDLKQLPKEALPFLAAEIRKTIIQTVSQTGGHLAPSLGTVELAIALHYVFCAPRDKIIWDVGHQAYAHKLLTGRYDRFSTLRTHGGISGFTRASESPYDAFSVGHSSTSISAGLGMACANALKNDPAKTIAVIGDGSMTAGLAYEGLNQAGGLHKDLIVVLNDNEMSIARNVGALSGFLSRKLSSSKQYLDWRKEFKAMLRPGSYLFNLMKRVEESVKTLITPGMLFEAFEFNYFGPINGHRMDHLIGTLDNIKELRAPALVHVITKKGKGYAPAENNPTHFHGVGCFEVKTGECVASSKSGPSFTQVFGETLVDLARKDPKIIAVTAAMPEGTGLADFAKQYPDRFFDVGIAEQHGVTFSAGLATQGFKPVVAVYSTFLQRAYDQVLHDVCLENLPVTFALDRGGLVGEDGPTHHGAFDLSYLRQMPNMVIMAPMDENELRHMIYTALSHDGPAAVRYPRGTGQGLPLDKTLEKLPLGKASVLASGKDLVIFAVGRMAAEAMTARKELAKLDVDACVINMRFIKPLDEKLILEWCKKVPFAVTAEENTLAGGFGSSVLEVLADAGLHEVKVSRVGIPDAFIEHGPVGVLRKKYGLDAQGIVQKAKTLLNK